MHQITLGSVALLLGATCLWSPVYTQDSITIGDSEFTLHFRPKRFGGAQKICRNTYNGNLATIDSDEELSSISDFVSGLFEARGEERSALLTGLRTNTKKNKLVALADTDLEGKRCVHASFWEKNPERANCPKGKKGKQCRKQTKGGQTGDSLRLFSKKCKKKRYFLCESPVTGDPPPAPPAPLIQPTTAEIFGSK